MNSLTSNNLAEVSYLLSLDHKLIDASLAFGSYGEKELAITLEGENIDLDRKLFLSGSVASFKDMPRTLQAVRNLLLDKEEAGL